MSKPRSTNEFVAKFFELLLAPDYVPSDTDVHAGFVAYKTIEPVPFNVMTASLELAKWIRESYTVQQMGDDSPFTLPDAPTVMVSSLSVAQLKTQLATTSTPASFPAGGSTASPASSTSNLPVRMGIHIVGSSKLLPGETVTVMADDGSFGNDRLLLSIELSLHGGPMVTNLYGGGSTLTFDLTDKAKPGRGTLTVHIKGTPTKSVEYEVIAPPQVDTNVAKLVFHIVGGNQFKPGDTVTLIADSGGNFGMNKTMLTLETSTFGSPSVANLYGGGSTLTFVVDAKAKAGKGSLTVYRSSDPSTATEYEVIVAKKPDDAVQQYANDVELQWPWAIQGDTIIWRGLKKGSTP